MNHGISCMKLLGSMMVAASNPDVVSIQFKLATAKAMGAEVILVARNSKLAVESQGESGDLASQVTLGQIGHLGGGGRARRGMRAVPLK